MSNFNERQLLILDLIRKNPGIQNKDIKAHLDKKLGAVSRPTVVRDLDFLAGQKLIKKEGSGRSVGYRESTKTPLDSYFDPNQYFKRGPDERSVSEKFNPNVFGYLPNIFDREEIVGLEKINKVYEKKIEKISPIILKKEIERMTIELSWKSSQLEGNTYTLIDTEILIKEHKEAKGHKKEEAIMILNHKRALDYIFSSNVNFKKLDIRKIENIHRLLVENMGVSFGIRKKVVGITGTKYRPLDNQYQIRESLEAMIVTVNKIKNPFAKTLAAILTIAYIQPFEDGNKRTSRLLGNAILYSFGICPLSYRSIDEADYKKAVILFYEQNSARFFKELFVEQFKFSVENYF